MDKSMHNPGLDKPKGRGAGDQGELSLKKRLDQLAEELIEVAEEMDTVSRESSTLEDIEGCKVLAAGVLEKYSALHNRLAGQDRIQMEQSIGPAVDRIKKGLTLLKEAPE
jgi:hypothetical protein